MTRTPQDMQQSPSSALRTQGRGGITAGLTLDEKQVDDTARVLDRDAGDLLIGFWEA